MSEATPMSIQPRPPPAEQLTAWQALIKRTGTTRPAPSTTRRPATTRAPTPATPPTTAATRAQLPAGWRAFTNRAGSSRIGVPPGFRVHTRQRYHAAVVQEQGGLRRMFTVRSQTPSARLPQASRDYRAWARRNFPGFGEVRYAEFIAPAGQWAASKTLTRQFEQPFQPLG